MDETETPFTYNTLYHQSDYEGCYLKVKKRDKMLL